MWASLFRETATTAEQSKRETVSVQNLFLAMIRRWQAVWPDRTIFENFMELRLVAKVLQINGDF